jgi:2-polyprenyl-6-methoxyphenol hydroxylase-like FAD-dependent oxidoreductase
MSESANASTAAGPGGGAAPAQDVPVVVAGGGPVGLALACELRLAGVPVTVLERLTEVDTTVKAASINTPSAELFYRRGLLPELAAVQEAAMSRFRDFARGVARPGAAPGAGGQGTVGDAAGAGAAGADAAEGAAGAGAGAGAGDSDGDGDGVRVAERAGGAGGGGGDARADGAVPPPRFAGHFAGIPLSSARLDADDPDLRRAGPAERVGFVPQAELERLLADRAVALGADLRRGVRLTGFEQDEHGVTVHTEGAGTLRTGWLVGCDGGRSTVRRLAGFDFPGTPPLITGHQAMAELEDTEGIRPGWNRTDGGVYAFGPMPGRVLTVEFDGPPGDRESPVTAEELETSLRRVTGTRVRVTGVRTATRFTDNARQVTDYRRGRVLLAGDAAHVHSPFGGQGLNLGIGDAANLGWKLAATIHGWAPEGLLDTYTAERHPIGAWVLRWTRAQVLAMRPDPWSDALREIVGDLLDTVDGTTHVVKRISGVTQRYELPGDHPLTGRSAPDLAFADGTRLGDALGDGRALLLDLTGDGRAPDGTDCRALAARYGDRLRLLSAKPAAPSGGSGGTNGSAADDPNGLDGVRDLATLFVRPDGIVAWAAAVDGDVDGDTAGGAEPGERRGPGLAETLARWLGAPAGPAA